jgi:uncharacterized protein YjhX (UPF0386 family)
MDSKNKLDAANSEEELNELLQTADGLFAFAINQKLKAVKATFREDEGKRRADEELRYLTLRADEAERRADEADEEKRKLTLKAAEEKFKAAKEKRNADEADDVHEELCKWTLKAAEEERKRLGTFYSLIDHVFLRHDEHKSTFRDTSLEFYQSCCPPNQQGSLQQPQKKQKRNKAVAAAGDQEPLEQQSRFERVKCRSREGLASNDPYASTFRLAKNTTLVAAMGDNQSRLSAHSQNRDLIWKNSVVEADPCGEISHLVPASVDITNSYWFVTDFLFGIDTTESGSPQGRSWEEICRLLHGSNATSDRRLANTGIKHMVTNKILLAGQKDYYEQAPCVLIIAILSREDALT